MNRRIGGSMKKLITIVLALLLCGLAWAEEDPVVVRVGDFSYPLSLAQQSLDSAVKLQEAMTGETLSEGERRRMAGDIIDTFVGIGLIEMKLTEAGRHDFTDEELEKMNSAARSRYEELWQSVYQMMIENETDVTEEEIVQSLEEEGYTLDSVFRELEVSERQRRAIEIYVPTILLSEKMIDEYYETQFLAPDRERYAHDIPRYEREVLAAKNESFYTPEGYRYLQQILLEYPESVTDALKPDVKKIEEKTQAVAEAYATLANAAATAKDWSELDAPRAAYDKAVAKLETSNLEYTQKRRELTLPLIQDTIDEIYRRAEKESFKELIVSYSADVSAKNLDDGYPFHPETEGWPKEFIEAASSLKNPGDISEPVFTELGVHILYYAGDMPSGDHVLTEDEKQMLNASALYYYQTQALTEMFEKWQSEYEIDTHPELLKY